MKTVYVFDENGRFVQAYEAQQDPVEEGAYIAPIRSTEIQPPLCDSGEEAIFSSAQNAWQIVPTEVEPLPVETHEQIINAKIKLFDQRIKGRLDDMARTLRFDNMAGAVAAACLPLGEYRQEDGAKLHLWSARNWKKGEEILVEFLSGERDEPTWEEVEAELPTYPII